MLVNIATNVLVVNESKVIFSNKECDILINGIKQ